VITEWVTLLNEVELEQREEGDEARAEIARQIRGALHAYEQRFHGIVAVIDGVEIRCMAVDGPVTPTHDEITDEELRTIYVLAGGRVQ